MKKIVIYLLCTVILLGLGVPVFAAEDTTSVFFASDYQFYSEQTPKLYGKNISGCQTILDNLLSTVKANGHNIEMIVMGGNYTANDKKRDIENETDRKVFGQQLQYYYGNNPNYSFMEIEKTAGDVFPDVNLMYVQGSHEPDTSHRSAQKIAKTGAYEFENYIIYVLNDEAFAGTNPRIAGAKEVSVVPNTIKLISDQESHIKGVADKMSAYFELLIERGEKRPVFIASHQPLHYAVDTYNGKAHYIFEAVNKAAQNLGIVFFFGNAEYNSDKIGGGLSCIEKGGVMEVCNDTLTDKNGNGFENKTINFTYMNYGFLGFYKGENNKLSASVIDITPSKLIISRYITGKKTVKNSYVINLTK